MCLHSFCRAKPLLKKMALKRVGAEFACRWLPISKNLEKARGELEVYLEQRSGGGCLRYPTS